MKMDNMRVATKLWLVILGLLLLMFAVTLGTQMRSSQATDEAERLVQQYDAAITTAVRWRGLAEMAVTMSMANVVTTDDALRKDFGDRIAALTARISPVQEQITKTATSPADKEALAQVAAMRAELRGPAMQDKVKALTVAADAAALRAFLERDYRPLVNNYLDSIDKFVTVQESQRDAAIQSAASTRSSVFMVVVVSGVLVFGLSMLLATLLVRSITRPLARAVAMAEAITAGDLTQSIQDDRKDEFGNLMRALTEMVSKLRSLVSEVRSGVESVSTASSEIANGNLDLSTRTEQTASNLQQTAASMGELTNTVNQSADTARQANQLAATAAQTATRGREVVGQVVSSMQHITASSKKISDIIGTIDGIAFQTNILALNAAVEAARAGEQGRGFAVVASEVRSLAQRSAEAAKEIKALINVSVETVESGSRQVEQAGQTMGEIVSSVQRVTDLIGEITASSNEQRDGIGHVNQAVANLDQMTQQNAALVEQSAAAASAMHDQAQRLAHVVSAFNVGGQSLVVGAGQAHRPAPRAVPRPAARLAPPVGRPALKLAGTSTAPKLAGTGVKPRLAAPARALAAPVRPAALATSAAGRPATPFKPVAAGVSRPVAKSSSQAKAADDDWTTF